ncbi:MAG: signal peptidase I [Cellulosilyticum sp.]|nr:signal peptidase I [Cellulosilyticum sp.]
MLSILGGVKRGLEFIKELVLIVLVALLFTIFIISHNKIPTSSMVSTINEGDHVLTTMLPYYYRDPEYGEIVVFKHGDESWVKRVIGKPGDEIDIIDGKVYRNGEMLDESAYLAEGMTSEPFGMDPIEFPYIVPEDHYFLLGDNRMVSQDCRYLGAIAREDIYGKAWIKIYPFNQIGKLK